MTHAARDLDHDTVRVDRAKVQDMLDAVARAGRIIKDQRRRLHEANDSISRLEGEKRALEARLRVVDDRAATPMAIVQGAVTRSDVLTDEAIAAMVREVDGSFALPRH